LRTRLEVRRNSAPGTGDASGAAGATPAATPFPSVML
jgi:hypothetical protein